MLWKALENSCGIHRRRTRWSNTTVSFMSTGESRWYQIICHATWSVDEPSEYQGAIGKAVDIHTEHIRMTDLERVASHDGLTGLLNRSKAEQMIRDRLMNNPGGNYALFIIDLDYLKMQMISMGISSAIMCSNIWRRNFVRVCAEGILLPEWAVMSS